MHEVLMMEKVNIITSTTIINQSRKIVQDYNLSNFDWKEKELLLKKNKIENIERKKMLEEMLL